MGIAKTFENFMACEIRTLVDGEFMYFGQAHSDAEYEDVYRQIGRIVGGAETSEMWFGVK